MKSLKNFKQQKGFAALLAVILIGIGVTVTSLGSIYGTQNIQGSNAAIHKQSQAQAKAWQGLEIVRIGLQNMNKSTLENLQVGNLSLTGLQNITAKIVNNTPITNGRRVTVNLTATGSDVNSSSSTIESIYEITFASGAGTSALSTFNRVNIEGDLLLSGYLNFTGLTDVHITVNGDVVVTGDIVNVTQLCATGNITIDSAITIDSVCTDGNLTVAQGALVKNAIVKGNVLVINSGRIETITANGTVTLAGGSASANSIFSTGAVNITGDTAYSTNIETESDVNWTGKWAYKGSNIKANGNVLFYSDIPLINITAGGKVTLQGIGNVNNVTSLGDVLLDSDDWGKPGFGINGTLNSAGNFVANPWTIAKAGFAKGTVTGTYSTVYPKMMVTSKSSLVVPFTPVYVSKIKNVFTRDQTEVDVYQLESSANYAFKIDGSGNKVVTVKDVNNIPNGTYFLAGTPADWLWGSPTFGTPPKLDYLCTSIDASGNCGFPSYPLCEGFSDYNECFSYDSTLKEWTIDGDTIATGVVWFEGSLKVRTGIYFNTFLATCDISTGGYLEAYAPNYVGYDGVCKNVTTFGRISNPIFESTYPKMFCEASTSPDVLAGSHQSPPIGNAVFIAGGYVGGTMQCGKVKIGAYNEIFGSIVAGNNFEAVGRSKVHGQIFAKGKGDPVNVSTTGGGIDIDASGFPSTYNPVLMPCTSNCEPSTPGTRMFWSKFL